MIVCCPRIVSLPDGGSRFEEVEFELPASEYAPPAPPLGASVPLAARSVGFIGGPSGWSSSPHPTPRRQFVVILSGTVEVTTTDGEQRHFGPGVAVLVEDVTGVGHRTRVISEEPWRAMAIALED